MYSKEYPQNADKSPDLDSSDEIRRAVSDILGRLNKVSLCHRVVGLGRGNATDVAQRWRVLGHGGSRW